MMIKEFYLQSYFYKAQACFKPYKHIPYEQVLCSQMSISKSFFNANHFFFFKQPFLIGFYDIFLDLFFYCIQLHVWVLFYRKYLIYVLDVNVYQLNYTLYQTGPFFQTNEEGWIFKFIFLSLAFSLITLPLIQSPLNMFLDLYSLLMFRENYVYLFF